MIPTLNKQWEEIKKECKGDMEKTNEVFRAVSYQFGMVNEESTQYILFPNHTNFQKLIDKAKDTLVELNRREPEKMEMNNTLWRYYFEALTSCNSLEMQRLDNKKEQNKESYLIDLRNRDPEELENKVKYIMENSKSDFVYGMNLGILFNELPRSFRIEIIKCSYKDGLTSEWLKKIEGSTKRITKW